MEIQFINEKTLSEMTSVSLPTLRRWAAEGRGPTRLKIGPGRVGYRVAEVVEWINSRTAYNGRGAKNAA
ncbi:helix-turn-helix transcriptional regulator [Acidocella facilis]|uniref:helix-turn-helix transcriptional regulator n=1 Tax=Acidocella facilis TaxID=525 RepID=UPI001F46C3EE|nr:AlpA family phage regulatory protein [Acidocella facilis]